MCVCCGRGAGGSPYSLNDIQVVSAMKNIRSICFDSFVDIFRLLLFSQSSIFTALTAVASPDQGEA